jgi:hypothetical protein
MGKEPTTGKVRAEDARSTPAAGKTEHTHPTAPIGCIVTVDGEAAIVIGYDPRGAIVEDAAGRISFRQGLEMPVPGSAIYKASQILARDRSWAPETPPDGQYPSMGEVLAEMHAAGGGAWDGVADPDASIADMRGEEEKPTNATQELRERLHAAGSSAWATPDGRIWVGSRITRGAAPTPAPMPASAERQLVEKVLRCKYCRGEMTGGGAAYAENPFCAACLDERLRRASGDRPVQWVVDGWMFIEGTAWETLGTNPDAPEGGAA